jgi:CRP/FNR family transcriptional regulator, cyclic AMP receptor protein
VAPVGTLSGVAALLGQARLFEGLNTAELLSLAGTMRETTFAQGQTIFRRGDLGDHLYLVLKGRVRLAMISPEGREISFLQAGAGTIFGEVAALDGKARTADATAITPVNAMALARSALSQLITNNPRVASGAVEFLCARLRDAAAQLESIALHPIDVRLARFLLARVQHQQPSTAPDRVEIDLGMSKGDLALFLGASQPKVSVAFASLEALQAIERKGSVIVCDSRALEAFVASH